MRHRTYPACCRRTSYLHHFQIICALFQSIVGPLNLSQIRTMHSNCDNRKITKTETTLPLSKWSQYGLKWCANGLMNGASTGSVHSRRGPSYAVCMGHFPCDSLLVLKYTALACTYLEILSVEVKIPEVAPFLKLPRPTLYRLSIPRR